MPAGLNGIPAATANRRKVRIRLNDILRPAANGRVMRVGQSIIPPARDRGPLAAARGPYVDQSQSLNLFLAAPTIGKLSSMYLYAWKAGLKTTYYLRSRPATRIQQATVSTTDTAAVACSVEKPDGCEACQ